MDMEKEEARVVEFPDEEEEELEEQLGSSLTLERVAAAKKYIENHYRSHMKDIQRRKERLPSSFSVIMCTFIYVYIYKM